MRNWMHRCGLLVALVALWSGPADAAQLISNGNFESGYTNWTCKEKHPYLSGVHTGCNGIMNPMIYAPGFPTPISGSSLGQMVCGYYSDAPYKVLWQTMQVNVAIPANVTTATLSFWISGSASEAPGTPNPDKIYVELWNGAGTTLLQTLAVYNGWVTAYGAWTQVTVPGLAAWKGTTVKIHFRTQPNMNEDDTWWSIDDVFVNTN
jgi:hypothetical protein